MQETDYEPATWIVAAPAAYSGFNIGDVVAAPEKGHQVGREGISVVNGFALHVSRLDDGDTPEIFKEKQLLLVQALVDDMRARGTKVEWI